MLACPLLQSSVYPPLSWYVVSGHSCTLCGQLQGPPRTYCRCQPPSYLSGRHLYIVCGPPPQCQVTVDDVFWVVTISLKLRAEGRSRLRHRHNKHLKHLGITLLEASNIAIDRSRWRLNIVACAAYTPSWQEP